MWYVYRLDNKGHSLVLATSILQVLTGLAGLVSLSLAGNPVVSETPHFRKTAITAATKLRLFHHVWPSRNPWNERNTGGEGVVGGNRSARKTGTMRDIPLRQDALTSPYSGAVATMVATVSV